MSKNKVWTVSVPKIVVRHVSKKGKLYKRVKTKQISDR